MSTIKVDTIATRTGSGNITLSNNVASLTSAGAISGTNLSASGTLAVTGNTTMGGTAAITGNTTVSGTLTSTGKITSTAGITFGSDTATANVLDDYEEGTFSPTLKNEGDTNLNTTKTSNNIGSYVKIGTSVQFQMVISINAVSGGSSQNLIVDDMPFVTKSISTNGYGGATVTYTAWNTTDPIAALVLSGSDNLRLMTGALQPATSNQLSNQSYIVMHGQYETAS